MHSDSKQRDECFDSILWISSPANWGCIKELSANEAIYSTFSIEL